MARAAGGRLLDRFVRIGTTFALIVAVLGFGVRAVTAGSTVPLGLTSLSAAMAPGDQQLVVSWRYATTGPPATSLALDLYNVEGGARVKVSSSVIGRTVEPDSYAIPLPVGTWMVIATPRNASGGGPGTASPAVRITNPCPTATLCARVSTAATPVKVRLAAQGFLSGTEYAVSVNGAKVAALH